MIDQTKNFMIGVFVVAAISLIIFIILFIHPTVGNEGKLLRVYFSNIDKVNVGTRVTFGGKPVGEVVSIREIENEANPRQPHDGVIYIYELVLAIDSSVDIYNTDEVSLRTSGLLGDKSVNITPLPLKRGQKLRVVGPNDVIYSYEGGSVEEALKDIQGLTVKIEEALEGFMSIVHEIQKTKVIKNFSDTFGNLRDITSAIDEPQRWNDILTHVDDVTRNASNSWPKIDEMIVRFSSAAENARIITEDGKQIALAVREGRGTLGRMLMSDDLHLQLSSILSKGETVLNDVNHYGLFFHSDKNWQRLRARRVNLLQQLCTPQEFRNFFNDEVDQIQTSLARVNMIIEETGTPGCCLIQNCEFVKVFSELLRRTEEIEENLHLYNIQLNECRVRETELDQSCGCCY